MIDANGTRFHLVLGEADWAAARFESCEHRAGIDAATLSRQPLVFRPQAADRIPLAGDRRSPTADRFGSIYFLGADRSSIWVQPHDETAIHPIWPRRDGAERAAPTAFGPVDPGPAPTPTLTALTVTVDHLLVAACPDVNGVLVFDLRSPGPPLEHRWPDAVPVVIDDLAPRPGGGLFAIDSRRSTLWELDALFRVVPAAPALPSPTDTAGFHRPGAAPPARPPDHWVPLVLPTAPIAVESLGDRVVLLDRAGTLVTVARDDDTTLTASTLPSTGPGTGFHDLTRHGDGLIAVHPDGNQAIAIDPQSGARATDFYPMRRYGGFGVVAVAGSAWYESDGRFVPLVRDRRERYAIDGAIVVGPFDGREEGCEWHRLFVDLDLPNATSVVVSCAASDRREDVAADDAIRWRRQPVLTRRPGSELPTRGSPSPHREQTRELLFQDVVGRYLTVRLELHGNVRSTPAIHALRIWYPRYSYAAHYLPAAWREDPVDRSFIDRFLAIFEADLTRIEDQISLLRSVVDPATATPEVLEWLASWLGIGLDPSWPADVRRALLRHADRVLAARGTKEGVRLAVRLAFPGASADDVLVAGDRRGDPRIIEGWSTVPTSPSALLLGGDHSARDDLLGRLGHWVPELGAGALDERWRQLQPAALYPIRPPDDGVARARWEAFSRSVLGFVPAAGDGDAGAWRTFLASRHPAAGALAAAYGKPGAEPSTEPLPAILPSATIALRDWYDFERTIVSRRRAAHRFRVLLPLPAGAETGDLTAADLERTLALAAHVIDAAKPAHTTFTVDWFHNVFATGLARLGDDTVLTRRPPALPAAVEGRAGVGGSFADGSPLDSLRRGR